MQGLEEAGWSVGRNLRIDMRWRSRPHSQIGDGLVALTPDVILSIGTNAAVALQQASRTVPVCERASGFSAPDVNGFRHRPGSNKVLACHSQKSPKSRAVRVLDREKLEPMFASISLLAHAKE